MIYRDEENPETHALHVFEVYCNADHRNHARDVFEEYHGHPRHVVAGPLGPVDETKVPKDAVWAN